MDASCFEISGNVPCRRVRENKTNELDGDEADDGAGKVLADLRTSSQKLQKGDGGYKDNESRKDKSAGAPNRSQDIASSQRSRRDEIMLKMLEQHAQMLKELATQRTGVKRERAEDRSVGVVQQESEIGSMSNQLGSIQTHH